MENDEIRNDMSGIDTTQDDIVSITADNAIETELAENVTPDNPLLGEVLDFYDCYDLMPLASRIIWLSSLNEAVGRIPDDIDLDYDELRLLVVLQEEQNKKMAYDNYEIRQENKKQQANNVNDINQIVHSG